STDAAELRVQLSAPATGLAWQCAPSAQGRSIQLPPAPSVPGGQHHDSAPELMFRQRTAPDRTKLLQSASSSHQGQSQAPPRITCSEPQQKSTSLALSRQAVAPV